MQLTVSSLMASLQTSDPDAIVCFWCNDNQHALELERISTLLPSIVDPYGTGPLEPSEQEPEKLIFHIKVITLTR